MVEKELLGEDINTERYTLNFKERAHISKTKLDTYSNVRYLGLGEFYSTKYENEVSTRYIAATPMTYDMLLSIYNINTREIGVYRLFRFDIKARAVLEKYFDSFKKSKPKFEVRVIGLQNNQDFAYLHDIFDIISRAKLPLVEVDIFGNETRHVSLDAKLGMSFNILLEDRLYRPGELVSNMTMEQFERQIK